MDAGSAALRLVETSVPPMAVRRVGMLHARKKCRFGRLLNTHTRNEEEEAPYRVCAQCQLSTRRSPKTQMDGSRCLKTQ